MFIIFLAIKKRMQCWHWWHSKYLIRLFLQCQSAALDELFGKGGECFQRYHTAQILLHSLAQHVSHSQDRALLIKCMYCFHANWSSSNRKEICTFYFLSRLRDLEKISSIIIKISFQLFLIIHTFFFSLHLKFYFDKKTPLHVNLIFIC